MADQTEILSILNKIAAAGQCCLNHEPDARVKLISTLETAQREIEGDGLYIARLRLMPLVNMSILIALETKTLHTIAQAQDKALTAAQISAATGQNAQFIARFMRLLTVVGIGEEIGPATYKSNTLIESLVTPEQEGAIRNCVELMFPIAGTIVQQLRKPQGISQFPDSGAGVTLFRSKYGKQSMFDFLETDAEHKKAFDDYMAGRGAGVRRPWWQSLPVQERLLAGAHQSSESVLLIDVGGGQGHKIGSFYEAFPTAPGRLILQDLPSTIRAVPKTLDAKVERMQHNFFDPQPIKGARGYFFSAIFHDWSDQRVADILRSTALAMAPGYSKMIIEDFVLRDVGEGFRGAALDMLMMTMPEGIERTRSEWEKLLGAAGLKLVQQWPGKPGTESVLEVELVAPM